MLSWKDRTACMWLLPEPTSRAPGKCSPSGNSRRDGWWRRPRRSSRSQPFDGRRHGSVRACPACSRLWCPDPRRPLDPGRSGAFEPRENGSGVPPHHSGPMRPQGSRTFPYPAKRSRPLAIRGRLRARTAGVPRSLRDDLIAPMLVHLDEGAGLKKPQPIHAGRPQPWRSAATFCLR